MPSGPHNPPREKTGRQTARAAFAIVCFSCLVTIVARKGIYGIWLQGGIRSQILMKRFTVSFSKGFLYLNLSALKCATLYFSSYEVSICIFVEIILYILFIFIM